MNKRCLFFDVDDVMLPTAQFVEKRIAEFAPEATEEYRRKVTEGLPSEDVKKIDDRFFEFRDLVLEEVPNRFKEKIDYNEIYQIKNLYPNVLEYINFIIENGSYDAVYAISHYNLPREWKPKQELLKLCFPNMTGIIPVQFHKEPYEKGKKRVKTIKALEVMELFGINDVHNFTLIDNSRSNVCEWAEYGGNGILFLPDSFDKKISLKDRMCKLIDLNPYAIDIVEHNTRLLITDGSEKQDKVLKK